MNKKEQAIISFLIKHKICAEPAIRLLGQGEQHINYLATEDDKKFVVRTLRDDVPTQAGFAQEHHQYLFLEAVGITFAPRSIAYAPDEEIHIVSYVEGTDASILDLDHAQREEFIEHLARLDDLSYEQYTAFCITQNFTPKAPQAWVEREKVNISGRLNAIGAYKGDPLADRVLAWAQQKIVRYTESFLQGKPHIHLLHGDLRWNKGGGNIRLHNGKVFFIDWEMCRFVDDSISELGDIIGSIPNATTHTVCIQDLISLYRKTPTGALPGFDTELEHAILYNTLGGPLWSAERYLLTKAQGLPNLERYEQITTEGMRNADTYYDRAYTEWFI